MEDVPLDIISVLQADFHGLVEWNAKSCFLKKKKMAYNACFRDNA